MKCLKNTLRKWLGVDDAYQKISNLEDQVKRLQNFDDVLEQRIRSVDSEVSAVIRVTSEYFRVDADVGHRGNNTIILTGIYRGKGYVQFYDVGQGEFKFMVERMRDMKRCNLIRTVDATMNFTGYFDIK